MEIVHDGVFSQIGLRDFNTQIKMTDAPHERADLINQFLTKINKTCDTEHRPATWKQVNGQLRDYSLTGLYNLMKRCERSRNFGAFFWWTVKGDRERRRLTSIA